MKLDLGAGVERELGRKIMSGQPGKHERVLCFPATQPPLLGGSGSSFETNRKNANKINSTLVGLQNMQEI